MHGGRWCLPFVCFRYGIPTSAPCQNFLSARHRAKSTWSIFVDSCKTSNERSGTKQSYLLPLMWINTGQWWKKVFLRGGRGPRTPLLVDQWHTAEGIISLGWLMMASTHRCLCCLSRGCLGLGLSLTPPSPALTTCRHLRWAAFFPERHRVSDTEEWTGKPFCLLPWETDGGEWHSMGLKGGLSFRIWED